MSSEPPRRCLFCAIAAGRSPAHLIHRDERLVAFLDIHPIRPGHVQIVPRDHHRYFDDLPADLAGAITVLGQRVAKSLKALFGVQRVGFLFTGSDIDHAHAHVVPLVAPTDITSRRYIAEERLTFRETPRPPDEELAETADQLRQSLAG